jgi:hypothetical protein
MAIFYRDGFGSLLTPSLERSTYFQVQVTLRLTVSQSVSLGIEQPPRAHDQIFIAVTVLFLLGALSDERWVCLLYMLLDLAGAVFLGS